MTDQPFTEEDRARVKKLRDSYLSTAGDNYMVARNDANNYASLDAALAHALDAALAHIDRLEGALEAADELARVVRRFGKTTGSLSTWREVYDTASRYEAARTRATLPTSKEGE